MTKFKHYPDQPKSELLRNAHIILCGAHDASSSFLDIFESTRQRRKAVGTPTDEEQDLLRAMLIFACAGLDSMAKQLIHEALPTVIELSEGASENFKVFIAKRLVQREIIDPSFLAEVIASRDPRDVLTSELTLELTSQSLQSKEQILRVASYFDIPSQRLVSDIGKLGRIFMARNEIAHEMDIDLGQPNRKRRPRRKEEMIDYTNEVFKIAALFLKSVDEMLVDERDV